MFLDYSIQKGKTDDVYVVF